MTRPTADASAVSADRPARRGRAPTFRLWRWFPSRISLMRIPTAAAGSALQRVDVSAAKTPDLLRSVNIPATLVEVANGLAYAVSGSTLRVVDVASGSVLQTLTLPGSGSATGFAREGTYLYA